MHEQCIISYDAFWIAARMSVNGLIISACPTSSRCIHMMGSFTNCRTTEWPHILLLLDWLHVLSSALHVQVARAVLSKYRLLVRCSPSTGLNHKMPCLYCTGQAYRSATCGCTWWPPRVGSSGFWEQWSRKRSCDWMDQSRVKGLYRRDRHLLGRPLSHGRSNRVAS